MAQYLLMGDIHLSDRPPSSCTDTYCDDILDILRAVGDIAGERNAAAIIWAGDVFHHKTPSRTTHRTLINLIDVVRAYPCPTYVVPGNHDMLNDRLSSINDTQPLGALIVSGVIQLLNGWMTPGYRYSEGWLDPVYGVPWLMRFDDDTVTAALAGYRDQPADHPHSLVVTHAPLYPPGRELQYEYYPTAAYAAAMNHHGSVFYGHVHEPHGIYTVGGVIFCNPGAISRGSLHEHNLHRGISIAAWDTDTGTFDLIPVPHKPADQVFRLAEAAQTKSEQLRLDDFLESIGQTRLEITSTEAVLAHLRSLKLSGDLEKLITDLLTEGAAR